MRHSHRRRASLDSPGTPVGPPRPLEYRGRRPRQELSRRRFPFSSPLYDYPVAKRLICGSIGKVKKNSLPFPGSLSTQIFPPCISTSFFEIDSPSPAPLALFPPACVT